MDNDSTKAESKLSNLNLEEGVWLISKIQDGMHYKYISDKIESIPNKVQKIELEMYRYKMAKNIRQYLLPIFQNGPVYADHIKVDRIMDAIFDSLED